MFLLSNRVEWTMIWALKVMFQIWPQVKIITWSQKVMLHASRSVSSAWTHQWCFHRSSLSLSKTIAEKLLVIFHDLEWPWWHDERSLVAIFRFGVSSLTVNRCLRVFGMVFGQKRRRSNLSHWFIMEVAKLTWLWVTDTKTPWCTFYRYCNGYQSLKVSWWSAIRWCYDDHSNFFWCEVTWRDLVTWLWVTWVWNFHNMCRKIFFGR